MTPKIPRGWLRLRAGTVIKKGDKFWSFAFNRWRITGTPKLIVGTLFPVSPPNLHEPLIYIRKIKK
jgi:hypothetical protein